MIVLDPAWHPFNRDLAAADADSNCPLLLCFPFAGGGASTYSSWLRAKSKYLSVIPVQLPGREHRIAETPFTNMDALLEALMETLILPLRSEIVLFGHSMGALIAARLAQRMAAAGRSALRLCVSGFPPPHFERARAGLHRLPQAEMLETLRRLNGLRPEVLANAELVELIVPTLYADLQLEETDLPAVRKQLTCPISLFSGIDDPLLGSEEIAAWREVTVQNVKVHRFSGDHFYLLKNLPEVLGLVEQDLVQVEIVV
jgi:medium-chain acyl-[acyl-carrier-protein] hydrolase